MNFSFKKKTSFEKTKFNFTKNKKSFELTKCNVNGRVNLD
jgi:hypothetical protein